METGRIRFALFINGQQKAVAGIRSHGVLSANLLWAGNSEVEITPQMRADPDFDGPEWLSDDIQVSLGGLDSETKEHLRWLRQDLRPGDEVMIRVLPFGEHDTPLERHVRQERKPASSEAEPPAV